jgi:RNA polymerase sigma-70 factor (ECF subfamily)
MSPKPSWISSQWLSGSLEAPLAPLADDELMSLARDDDQAAFDALVRRHQTRVLRLAARYLGDVALASDVAQNTFLELYRNRHRYDARGRFVSYLCRLALNQCRMVARAASTARRRAPSPPDSLELGADLTLLRDQRNDLQWAVERLSEKLRAVVILRFGGDLDLSEIADALSLPVGTVKRRLFDAMAKLRALLEEPR